jgi:alpha-1,2-mannosyltransferase
MSLGVLALGLVLAAKRQIDSGNDVNGLVCIGFGSLLASPVSWTHHWVWGVLALLVLVQSRRNVAAVVLCGVFVIGPMWFAPREQLVELHHLWWQAAACVSYVVIGLTYLIFFATSRQGSGARPTPSGASAMGRSVRSDSQHDKGQARC